MNRRPGDINYTFAWCAVTAVMTLKGLRPVDVYRPAGINRVTFWRFRRSRPVEPATIAKLEAWLGWPAGRFDRDWNGQGG